MAPNRSTYSSGCRGAITHNQELAGYPGVETSVPRDTERAEILTPLKLTDPDGESELAFFSRLSTFGTAVDVTLSELAIEAFYPANAHTAMRLLHDIGAS
jgi:hypothetical protein